MLEQAKEIITFHKEKCFKCGNIVEKNQEGYYRCSCGYEWANLFIKRMPVKAFIFFKEYADKEFCSDYGMAFKSLMERPNDLEIQMLEVMRDLNNRVSNLEQKKTKRTTLSGREIKKEEEKDGKI